MIQRIQTLFLLAAAVLAGLLITGSLLEMTDLFGNRYILNYSSVTATISEKAQVQNIWPLAIIIICVPVSCLISIFLYRNRRLQMKMTLASLLLSLGSLFVAGFFVIMLGRKVDLTYIWNIKVTFPLVEAILCWLAYRAIQRDDEKVKSLDRIR